ncbi:MAG: TetR/AcrR family transcriptional regulator, partial [Proteobacteria bacterium]
MVKSTKQSLIEAAIDLFAEKGVHWVSFQQIGTRVGITQAALYKHFADKDDLLR